MGSRLDDLADRQTTVGTTTQNAVKTGKGRLIGAFVNPTTASSGINIRDNTVAASGTVLVTIGCLVTETGDAPATPGYIPLNIPFSTGLSIEATGTPSYCVIWE